MQPEDFFKFAARSAPAAAAASAASPAAAPSFVPRGRTRSQSQPPAAAQSVAHPSRSLSCSPGPIVVVGCEPGPRLVAKWLWDVARFGVRLAAPGEEVLPWGQRLRQQAAAAEVASVRSASPVHPSASAPAPAAPVSAPAAPASSSAYAPVPCASVSAEPVGDSFPESVRAAAVSFPWCYPAGVDTDRMKPVCSRSPSVEIVSRSIGCRPADPSALPAVSFVCCIRLAGVGPFHPVLAAWPLGSPLGPDPAAPA
ncbi:hypothetical protein KEM55_003513 [Ascosphaera atra]|nr:hypothetical protein KEM55_003513 [Ascosphaera atra]